MYKIINKLKENLLLINYKYIYKIFSEIVMKVIEKECCKLKE